ncbi:MAG: ABC transporter substrate binding protein [Thermodesulfobacteriota bacterium]
MATLRILLLALLAMVLCCGQARAGTADAVVVWVDSYHQGYEWSDGIERGIRSVLDPVGVRLQVIRLDAKLNPAEETVRKAGKAARDAIARIGPAAVIASDDAAQEYLVVPHLKGAALPVVFCGVNWDATMYGYPAPNVTGMVEVEAVPEMVSHFARDAKGDRIGYISGDTATDRKIVEVFNRTHFDGRMRAYFAETFEQFKSLFLRAQSETDMLFLRNNAGISGWDPAAAEAFLRDNTRAPTGSHLLHMDRYVVYTMGKVPEEQGEWAARTVLRVLAGESPGSIPLGRNQRTRLVVNLKMAKAAGVVLPISVLKTAEVIGKD